MNYPEELREKYNEVMYDEMAVIEKFLKDQYDLRYGRQRDSWHFEPAIEVIAHNGSHVLVHDVKLDKDRFVVFDVEAFCEKSVVWECFDFAYGELSKVIEALPNAEDVVRKNAIHDLKVMSMNIRIDYLLTDAPFKYEVNGKFYAMDDVKCVNNELSLVQALGNDTPVSDLPTEVLVNLRDHINIEYLHRTNEYKEVMQWLALEPNLRKSVDEYDKTNYGCVLFTLAGTDIEFDMSAIQRDDKGNLTIFGADTCCEDELITLTEKDIKKEYLEVILKWLTKRVDIMDTYNAHNAELVRKINAAWKKEGYHKLFGTILLALLYRDNMEYEQKFGEILEYSEEYAMEHAHEIMEGVCDDQDLECILNFIRYEEE